MDLNVYHKLWMEGFSESECVKRAEEEWEYNKEMEARNGRPCLDEGWELFEEQRREIDNFKEQEWKEDLKRWATS